MRRLLVLRPEPGASATLERAQALGLDAVAAPLFEVEPLAWDLPERSSFDALLLTSANAVRCGGEQLRALLDLPAYAVGDATAAAARQAGLNVLAVGNAGVEELLATIEPKLKLVHPCGEHRHHPLDARQRIAALPVYRAAAIESPALGDVEGAVALIHSPRSAQRFASLVDDRRPVCIAAISTAAAEAAGKGWQAVEVADAPTDDALLALAARLCNKPALE